MGADNRIQDLALNKKERLEGFKIGGIFPLYLRFITVSTHIRMSAIKEKIQELKKGEITPADFDNTALLKDLIPLMIDYITEGIINGRGFGFLIRPFLKRKLWKCGHAHIMNLFVTLYKKNDPAFFLTYWKLITQKVDTK